MLRHKPPEFSADTVKRFDAITGKYQGVFVQPAAGGLHGPRGLIFGYRGDLLVSNQNVDLDPSPGRYCVLMAEAERSRRASRETDAHAPVSPQGIASSENRRHLFVADLGGDHQGYCHGTLKMFTANGRFVANLNLPSATGPGLLPSPRCSHGHDRLVYVSNMPMWCQGAAALGDRRAGSALPPETADSRMYSSTMQAVLVN